LLGEPVRWDGGHKRDAYITETLSRHFELVPICPEAAIGLGVPREPIRLAGAPDAPRAVGLTNPDLDVTAELSAFGRKTALQLADLSGYLFKSGSPSCGAGRVKVYREQGGRPAHAGVGLYAQEIQQAWPLLPVEEEGRLGDPERRETFLECVFAYRRWRVLSDSGLTAQALAGFHGRHKLALLAHAAGAERKLGRLVAAAGRRSPRRLAAEYGPLFMSVLRKPAARRGHANALLHAMGYLKRVLDAEDRGELAESIERFRRGQVPRVVPLTLLRQHLRRHPEPHLDGQTYLEIQAPELLRLTGS
jgi:uncharacterized protein YbgA (DUF1722 family)/uncharacterized protein YbbK (DUF523 family)